MYPGLPHYRQILYCLSHQREQIGTHTLESGAATLENMLAPPKTKCTHHMTQYGHTQTEMRNMLSETEGKVILVESSKELD